MAVEKATFGAGCFWGVEARFAALPGVLDTAAGYAGGDKPKPTYDQVCEGATGHAEVVEVSINPERISYRALLAAFFAMHNPAQPYRKGASAGTTAGPQKWNQYRSVLFTHTDEQARAAREYMTALEGSAKYPAGFMTEVLPAPQFWRAEEHHQQYYAKRNITAS